MPSLTARAAMAVTRLRSPAPRGFEREVPEKPGDMYAVTELAVTQRQLVLEDDGEVDTKSEAGQAVCTKFLDMVMHTADRLQCEVADRSYRHEFTTNYRVLFPDCARRYRTDVLEACVDRLDAFFVNGEEFRLGVETLQLGERMHYAWSRLCKALSTWDATDRRLWEVRKALSELDHAWADFEHQYISELIAIEERARRVIVRTIELEHRLSVAEKSYGQASDHSRLARRRLAAKFAEINATANTRRKGRSDLHAEVLEAAYEVLGEGRGQRDAAALVALQVVRAFSSLRDYFRLAKACLERIDPYLGNNAGLVDRLADWEEIWEIGNTYLMDGALRRALSQSVARIGELKDSSCAFEEMCEDCDAELFLVLPRLVWLAFLRSPPDHAALLRSVVPHLFRGAGADTHGSETFEVGDKKLHMFMSRYRSLRKDLADAFGGGEGHDSIAYELLLRWAVGADGWDDFDPDLGASHLSAVRAFMLELETWSMVLQRHCPDDWNACSAVLMKTLSAGR